MSDTHVDYKGTEVMTLQDGDFRATHPSKQIASKRAGSKLKEMSELTRRNLSHKPPDHGARKKLLHFTPIQLEEILMKYYSKFSPGYFPLNCNIKAKLKYVAGRMSSVSATVMEFETRVRKVSCAAKSGNIDDIEWNTQIAKAEFLTLNTKLKQLYGQELIPIIHELDYETSGVFQSSTQTDPAQSEDFTSSLLISITATISVLAVCVYLYNYFIEDMEPHMRFVFIVRLRWS